MNVATIASQIRVKMSEGVAELKRSPTMRMAVDDIIKRNGLLDATVLRQMTDEELMAQLTKALLLVWPVPLALAYEAIGQQLTSFADIVRKLEIKDPAINKLVRVTPPCALRDSRIPPGDFIKDLFRLLFAELGPKTKAGNG